MQDFRLHCLTNSPLYSNTLEGQCHFMYECLFIWEAKCCISTVILLAPRDKKTVGEYLLWESEDGNAHLHGGFRYCNGSLVIPTKGWYRVFLQLTYESNTESKFDLKLSNTVVLYHDSYPSDVTLLSSVDTVSHSTKQWSKSLHTSGIFLMEANSRLRVKSANANLISSEEHLVFFGAELLSQ